MKTDDLSSITLSPSWILTRVNRQHPQPDPHIVHPYQDAGVYFPPPLTTNRRPSHAINMSPLTTNTNNLRRGLSADERTFNTAMSDTGGSSGDIVKPKAVRFYDVYFGEDYRSPLSAFSFSPFCVGDNLKSSFRSLNENRVETLRISGISELNRGGAPLGSGLATCFFPTQFGAGKGQQPGILSTAERRHSHERLPRPDQLCNGRCASDIPDSILQPSFYPQPLLSGVLPIPDKNTRDSSMFTNYLDSISDPALAYSLQCHRERLGHSVCGEALGRDEMNTSYNNRSNILSPISKSYKPHGQTNHAICCSPTVQGDGVCSGDNSRWFKEDMPDKTRRPFDTTYIPPIFNQKGRHDSTNVKQGYNNRKQAVHVYGQSPSTLVKQGWKSSQKRFLSPWDSLLGDRGDNCPDIGRLNQSRATGSNTSWSDKQLPVTNKVTEQTDKDNIEAKTRYRGYNSQNRKRAVIGHRNSERSMLRKIITEYRRVDGRTIPDDGDLEERGPSTNGVNDDLDVDSGFSSNMAFPSLADPSENNRFLYEAKRDVEVSNSSQSDRKLFQCPQCSYVTDRKNNLKRHIVTMHQASGKTLECCGFRFHSKAALREHNSVCHRGGYRCSFCARNFCRKALLRRHLTVHSGQKDFFCELCGYATSHKSNLERHQKVHSKKDGGSKHAHHTDIHELWPRVQMGNGLCLTHDHLQYHFDNINFTQVYRQGQSNDGIRSGRDLPIPDSALLEPTKVEDPQKCSFSDGPNLTQKRRCSTEKLKPYATKREDIKRSKFLKSPDLRRRLLHRPTKQHKMFIHRSRRLRGFMSRRLRETYSQSLPDKGRTSDFRSLGGYEGLKLPETKNNNETCEEAKPDTPVHNDAIFRNGDIRNSNAVFREILNSKNSANVAAIETCSDAIDQTVHAQKSLNNEESILKPPTQSPTRADNEVTVYKPDFLPCGENNNNKTGNKNINSVQQREETKRRLCLYLYSCPECEEKFSTQTALGQHMTFCCATVEKKMNFDLPLVMAFKRGCIK